MFSTVIFVALGGALGAVLRYLVGLAVAFPMGTMVVNVLGSFLIGLVWGQFENKDINPNLIPFLIFGLLGGFTTFSTFSLDTLKLIQDGRFLGAGGYIVASVVWSLIACFLGYFLTEGSEF